MKGNRLTIQINRPVSEVFEFTVNPQNTPKWVAHIAEEQSEEWPPQVGTIYRNRGQESDWDEFKVTQFEENKVFELSSLKDTYHVVLCKSDLHKTTYGITVDDITNYFESR